MDHDETGMGSMMQPTPANPYPPSAIEPRRGGIEMSRIVLAETSEAKLREMANETIADQTREIDTLDAWLRQQRKSVQ